MLVKIFSTATLIVLAWLSVQMLQTQQSVDVVQADFRNSLAEMRAEISAEISAEIGGITTQNDAISTDIFTRMDQFAAQQAKFKKSANAVDPKLIKAKNQTIVRMQQTAELQNVYTTVLKADLAARDKQGSQAAKLLTSTKKTIWKTSDKWGKSKTALRELMAPIDILAGKWERGDYTSNTQAIQDVLLAVIETQSNS